MADFNFTQVEESSYKIPLIFVRASEEEPLYRIDMLGSFFDLKKSLEESHSETSEYHDYLSGVVYSEGQRWCRVKYDREVDGGYEILGGYVDNPIVQTRFLCLSRG